MTKFIHVNKYAINAHYGNTPLGFEDPPDMIILCVICVFIWVLTLLVFSSIFSNNNFTIQCFQSNHELTVFIMMNSIGTTSKLMHIK